MIMLGAIELGCAKIRVARGGTDRTFGSIASRSSDRRLALNQETEALFRVLFETKARRSPKTEGQNSSACRG